MTLVRYTHFISKRGDIAFSIACGVGAYFLYERDHPREWTLMELVQRKLERLKTEGWVSERSS